MKKSSLILVFGILFGLSLVSCSNGADSAEEKAAVQTVQKMDSIATEIDKSINTLETKTKEAASEVDDLLNSLDGE